MFCLTNVELQATVSVWGSDPTRSEGEHMADKDADFEVTDFKNEMVRVQRTGGREMADGYVAYVPAFRRGAYLDVEAATGLRDWLSARLEAMPTPRYTVITGEGFADVLEGVECVATFFDKADPSRAERLARERCAELNREVSP
jgi:hypothetical protein